MSEERKMKPPYDDHIDAKKTLPAEMHQMIYNVLSEFEYSINQIADISKHILITDIDTALEDSVSMMVWFNLHANKSKEREEYWTEQLKRMEAESVKKGTAKTVSANKADIKNNETYIKAQAAIRRYKTIRRNCEDLARAMELRKEVAQTKSSNSRSEVGGYSFK